MTEFNGNSPEQDLGYDFTIFGDGEVSAVQEPVTGPVIEGDVIDSGDPLYLRPEGADPDPSRTVGIGGFTYVEELDYDEPTQPIEDTSSAAPHVSVKPPRTPKPPRQQKPPKPPKVRPPVDVVARERRRRHITTAVVVTAGVLSVGSVLVFTPWDSVLPNQGNVAVAPPSKDTRPTIPAVPSTEVPTAPTIVFPTMSEPSAPVPTVTITSFETATATATATTTETATTIQTATATATATATKTVTARPKPSAKPSQTTTPTTAPTETTPAETPTETAPTETPSNTAQTEDPTTPTASASETVVIGASDGSTNTIRNWWDQLWHRGEQQTDINDIRQKVIDGLRAKGFNVVDAGVSAYPDQAAFGLTLDTDGHDMTLTYTRSADELQECVTEQTAGTLKDQLEYTAGLQGLIKLKEKGGNPFSVNGNIPSLRLSVGSDRNSVDLAAAISGAAATTAVESDAIQQACESIG